MKLRRLSTIGHSPTKFSACATETCLTLVAVALVSLPLPVRALGIERSPETGELLLRVPPSSKRGVLETSTNLAAWSTWAAIDAHATNLQFGLPASSFPTLFLRFRETNFTLPDNMVWIAPGEFEMGSPDEEIDRKIDETQHRVRIPRGFWMARYEVTVAEFVARTRFNPSLQVQDPSSRRPVDNLSAVEADDYCTRLTEALRQAGQLPPGTTARLPTEAEWEYACRAGTSTRLYYGEDPEYDELPRRGWYVQNAGGSTWNVGLLPPNPWGLYDMIGNVFEYCIDANNAYPEGVMQGFNYSRIRRGGSFYCPPDVLRSAERHPREAPPTERDRLVGMRVVIAAAPDTARFPPVVEPLTPDLVWNEDSTSVIAGVATATPDVDIRYTDNGWPPSYLYGSDLPYLVTGPAMILARGFKPNHVASSTLAFQIEHAPPPSIRVTPDGQVSLSSDDPAAWMEWRHSGFEIWFRYSNPLNLSPGDRIEIRVRSPGKLTSQTVEITGS